MAELKTNRLQFVMSETERAMLNALAEYSGLTVSDVLRQAIRRDYRAQFGDAKPKKRKR